MIKYNLTCCSCKVVFNSWFSGSEEFEKLKKRKLITCIDCNSQDVKKSIMAPNVSNFKRIGNETYKFRKNLRKKILKYQKFINENFNYVGDNFAREARTIHYDKQSSKYDKQNSKCIYGKATLEEINELHEEGIETTTIPWIKKTEN